MSYDGNPSVKLKTDVLRALFPNDDCILVGGAMTTPKLWDTFEENPCHLFEDGRIMRHGQQIGTVADIEIEAIE